MIIDSSIYHNSFYAKYNIYIIYNINNAEEPAITTPLQTHNSPQNPQKLRQYLHPRPNSQLQPQKQQTSPKNKSIKYITYHCIDQDNIDVVIIEVNDPKQLKEGVVIEVRGFGIDYKKVTCQAYCVF